MSWLSNWWHGIVAKAETIWSKVSPAVEADLEQFAEALAEIVLGAVTEQIPLALSGGEKFATAVKNVIDQAKTKGLAVSQIFAGKLVQDTVTALAAAQNQPLAASIPTQPALAAATIAAVSGATLGAATPPAS